MKKFIITYFLSITFLVSTISMADTSNALLYSVELREKEALILIDIKDPKGKPVSGVAISVKDVGRNRAFSKTSDEKGMVVLIVQTNKTYDISFLTKDTVADAYVERFEISAEEQQRHTLSMVTKAAPEKDFSINNIIFPKGAHELSSAAIKHLNNLIEYMRIKPSVYIIVAGHTDNTESPKDSFTLSEKRAQAVKKYLVASDIATHRVATTGYGDSKPATSNKNEAGKRKNRRVEIEIKE